MANFESPKTGGAARATLSEWVDNLEIHEKTNKDQDGDAKA